MNEPVNVINVTLISLCLSITLLVISAIFAFFITDSLKEPRGKGEMDEKDYDQSK